MHHWVSEQFRICKLDVVILVQISLKFFLKNLHLSCHYPSYWDILFIKFFNSLRNFCLGINLIEIYQTYNFLTLLRNQKIYIISLQKCEIIETLQILLWFAVKILNFCIHLFTLPCEKRKRVYFTLLFCIYRIYKIFIYPFKSITTILLGY